MFYCSSISKNIRGVLWSVIMKIGCVVWGTKEPGSQGGGRSVMCGFSKPASVCDKDRRPPNLIRGNSLYLSLCWENPTPATHLSHLPYHRGVILNQSSLYFNTSCIMYLLLCIENFCHRISLFLYFCAHGVWSLSLDVRNSPQDLLKLFECDADSSYGLNTMGPFGSWQCFFVEFRSKFSSS